VKERARFYLCLRSVHVRGQPRLSQAKYTEAAVLTEQLQGIKSVQAFELDKLKRRCAAAEEAAAEGKAELRRRTTAVRNHEITAQRLAEANAQLEHEVAELREFKVQSVAAVTAAAAAAAAEESKEKGLRDDDEADKVAELGWLAC
jgi:hypothetical protein